MAQDKPNKRNISGPNNPFWKGGRTVASNGYMLVRVGTDHHLADVRGYAYEHRMIAEKKLGRKLECGELVHHIDGDRANNSPDNIDVCRSNAEHSLRHRKDIGRLRLPGEGNPLVTCACGCGAEFTKFDSLGRPRMYVSGHNARRSYDGRYF